jgi:hypothetical protein
MRAMAKTKIVDLPQRHSDDRLTRALALPPITGFVDIDSVERDWCCA